MQLMHFSYWKATDHPVWNLVTGYPQHFFEEDGELSLSLLSRSATCHGIHFDRSYLKELYKLLHDYRKTAADVVLDCEIKAGNKKHYTVHLADPEVTAITLHFQIIITQLRQRTWWHYPRLRERKSKYKKLERMILQAERTSIPRFRLPDFESRTKLALRRMHHHLFEDNDSFWIPEHEPSSTSESNPPPPPGNMQGIVVGVAMQRQSSESETDTTSESEEVLLHLR